MAFLSTSIGALPAVFSKTLSERTRDTLLGFGAGVMLAATGFSLITPGLETARQLYESRWTAALLVSAGILGGVLMIRLLERLVPHEHFYKGEDQRHDKVRSRLWLFVMAIIIHNIPEGFAIGVAAGSGGERGFPLALGISLQDLPEGLVVALALRELGYRRRTAFAVAAFSGFVEPVAALIGTLIVGIAQAFLAWGLALAAGAMLFVISHEVIPECHRRGSEMRATWGLVLGFVLMMTLDYALG